MIHPIQKHFHFLPKYQINKENVKKIRTKWGNRDENMIGCLICHFNRGKHTKSTGTPKLQFYVVLCCLQAYDINFVSCNFVVVSLDTFFVISSVIKYRHRSHWLRDENKSSNNK